MKFCVNRRGTSLGGIVERASWNTEKPHDFRSGDASDDNDDGDEEFDIEADDELRQKIAAALNMKEGDEEEEDDEVVIDDEEMLKLDDQLAAVFRMQQGPKSDKKRADSECIYH